MRRYTYSSSKEEIDSCRGTASWTASANFSKFYLNSSGWFLNEFLRLASKTRAIIHSWNYSAENDFFQAWRKRETLKKQTKKKQSSI